MPALAFCLVKNIDIPITFTDFIPPLIEKQVGADLLTCSTQGRRHIDLMGFFENDDDTALNMKFGNDQKLKLQDYQVFLI